MVVEFKIFINFHIEGCNNFSISTQKQCTSPSLLNFTVKKISDNVLEKIKNKACQCPSLVANITWAHPNRNLRERVRCKERWWCLPRETSGGRAASERRHAALEPRAATQRRGLAEPRSERVAARANRHRTSALRLRNKQVTWPRRVPWILASCDTARQKLPSKERQPQGEFRSHPPSATDVNFFPPFRTHGATCWSGRQRDVSVFSYPEWASRLTFGAICSSGMDFSCAPASHTWTVRCSSVRFTYYIFYFLIAALAESGNWLRAGEKSGRREIWLCMVTSEFFFGLFIKLTD